MHRSLHVHSQAFAPTGMPFVCMHHSHGSIAMQRYIVHVDAHAILATYPCAHAYAQVVTEAKEFAAVRDQMSAKGLSIDDSHSGLVYLPIADIEASP